MKRNPLSLTWLCFFLVLGSSTVALGQGVLIVTNADTVVRLPRPIIIHPRRPVPRPQPPMSYAIKVVPPVWRERFATKRPASRCRRRL